MKEEEIFKEKVYDTDFNNPTHKKAEKIARIIKNGKSIFKIRTLDDKLFYCHIELWNGLALHVYSDNCLGILYPDKVSKKINGQRRFINKQIIIFEDNGTKNFYLILHKMIDEIRYFEKYNEEIDIITLQDICLSYLDKYTNIISVPNRAKYPFDKKYN